MGGGCSIAKYYRLSSEDEDLKQSEKRESNSISNQRNLVEDFIARDPELAAAPAYEYFDDGWSGKNFDRPNVRRMLEDARRGKVNCIVVKDISRFGRDYLAVGNYLSRVFPFLGVRFIAINDGFDSIRPLDIDSLETSFKTLLYDLYSRDLSRKVRGAKQQRARRGDYQAPFAPFGYVKDPADKRRLQIDPEAAAVVRHIFAMASSGMGAEEIAKKLNGLRVSTQMVYKRLSGCSRGEWPCAGPENFWTRHAVTVILRDERYMGRAVYGKRSRRLVGDTHTVKNQRADWIVVENAHPGIVTEAEFREAQESLRAFRQRIPGPKRKRPLFCPVRCGVCGHRMTRVDSAAPYYLCETPRVTDAYPCPAERIPEAELAELLRRALRIQRELTVDAAALDRELGCRREAAAQALRRELSRLREELDRQSHSLRDLYELYVGGELDKDAYLREKEGRTRARDSAAARLAELQAQPPRRDSSPEEIAEAVAGEALESVSVYPGHRLILRWSCRNELDGMETP